MNFVTVFKCAHYAQQVNRIAHSAHSLRRLTIPLARVTPVRRPLHRLETSRRRGRHRQRLRPIVDAGLARAIRFPAPPPAHTDRPRRPGPHGGGRDRVRGTASPARRGPGSASRIRRGARGRADRNAPRRIAQGRLSAAPGAPTDDARCGPGGPGGRQRNPNFRRTRTMHTRLTLAANIRKKLGASAVWVIAIRLSIQNGAKPPNSVTPTL